MLHGHPGVSRRSYGGKRILHVMGADQRPLYRATRLARFEHFELGVIAQRTDRPGAPQRILVTLTGEALERSPATHGERLTQPDVLRVPDNAAATRHDAYEMMKLPLY